MSDSGEKNNESLPLGDLERIDKVCSQFEETWKAGNPARIEELLLRFAGQVRDKLLLELLLLEFEYRSRSDADVPIEEYRQRFPEDLDIVEQAIEQSSHDQTILTPGQSVDAQLIPERIRYLGDYEILQEIARGGMGVVFKARQSTLGRIVAVKMMLSGQLSTDEQIARFEREAKLAGRLQHPNIVAVHEVGRHEGMPYFSMDFVNGHSLSEVVRAHPLLARIAAGYVQVAAETVHNAHEKGILHRDLKPSNILIDEEDRVRITDFGLAKFLEAGDTLTATESIIGTPSYMPPEQAVGNKALIGVQSDVYSLGAVLYELLTGRPPFAAATAIETIHQVVTKELVSPRVLNPDVPKDLETICLKCLRKEPDRRYATCRELEQDLTRWLQGRPIQARPVSWNEKAILWCKRRPAIAGSIAAILLTACIVTGFILVERQRNRLERIDTAVSAMSTAQGDVVPFAIDALDDFPSDLVQEALRKAFDSVTDDRKLPLACALAHFGDERVGFLVPQIENDSLFNEVDNLVVELGHARSESIAALEQSANKAEREQNWRHKARLAVLALHLKSPSLAQDMCRSRPAAMRAVSLFSLPRIRSPFSSKRGTRFLVPGSVKYQQSVCFQCQAEPCCWRRCVRFLAIC